VTSSLDRIAAEALAIEREDAKEAGALGYMAQLMVQATMPHSDPKATEFRRENGPAKLVMYAPSDLGLPYGRYPRLLLSWVTTEAVITKSPKLRLGGSLSEFLEKLHLPRTGGKRGTIGRLRDQMERLFGCTILGHYQGEDDGKLRSSGRKIDIAEEWDLWWDPKNPGQLSLEGSTVTLSDRFFRSVVGHPIPIDMRALRALRSSLGLDLYCWLTLRMSYLRKPTEIPWEALALQFGSDYKRQRAFKEAVLKQLRQVVQVYPDVRVAVGDVGLVLKPSPTHIKKLGQF